VQFRVCNSFFFVTVIFSLSSILVLLFPFHSAMSWWQRQSDSVTFTETPPSIVLKKPDTEERTQIPAVTSATWPWPSQPPASLLVIDGLPSPFIHIACTLFLNTQLLRDMATSPRLNRGISQTCLSNISFKAGFGSGGKASGTLDPGSSRYWTNSFMLRPIHPPGRNTLYELDRRLAGPHNRSGHNDKR
jgi:hypothetical protein